MGRRGRAHGRDAGAPRYRRARGSLSRRQRRRARRRIAPWQIAAVVALAALAAVALISLGSPGTPAPSDAPGAATKVRGDPAAKIEIEEWADFQCPFCGRYALGIERDVIRQYVDTGQAKIVWRQYAFLGQESVWAAEASECANDQGRFWAYHDKLFSEQAGEERGTFRRDALKRFASDVGLDRGAFDACLDSDRHLARVNAELAAGRAKGVNATPTFFINGRRHEGAPTTLQQMRDLIDAAK